MPEQNQNSSATEPPSFEQALASLEQIVRDLEAGGLGLAESLARYEEGVKLLRQCHGLLERAQRRIELLTGVDAAGKPSTEPFDDRATLSDAADPPGRPRRGGKTEKKLREQISSPEANRESASPAVDEPGSLF
ncbi:MAG TPA: exodeoxyribonuclease VII small subunit [Pirellulales bacterium]|nr:exodeoxyribonuclease VII small subunit [Pirellulales bacterium]